MTAMEDYDYPAPSAAPTVDDDMSWDGRIADGPNGPIIWRGNRRTGRFVALNYENADPQSRERVERLTQQSDIGRATLPIAREFIQRNATIRTGGWQNDPELPGWQRGIMSVLPGGGQLLAGADRMRNLSARMVGSNWQPGTTGMMNTATEMAQTAFRYPTPQAMGRANSDNYIFMAGEIAAQQAAAASMRTWLSRRPNLEGWEEEWRPQEARIRAQAEADARQFINQTHQRQPSTRDELRNTNRSGPAPAPARQRQYDPQDPSTWTTEQLRAYTSRGR